MPRNTNKNKETKHFIWIWRLCALVKDQENPIIFQVRQRDQL